MEELKESLRWCMGIPEKVSQLEYEKTKISKRFYEEESVLSLSLSGDISEVSQRGYRPDQAAITIIQREEYTQRKIDRLNEIYRLFSECLENIKIDDLKSLLCLPDTSNKERRAYQELQEVISYMFFKYYGTEFEQEDYAMDEELYKLSNQLDLLIRRSDTGET